MLVRRHTAVATYFRGGEWQGAGLAGSLDSAWAAGEKVWNDHSDGSQITYDVGERSDEEHHHKIEQRGIEPNHRNDIEDNEPKFDMRGLEVHDPYHVSLVDINRIGPRLRARELPLSPLVDRGVIDCHLSCVPLAYPNLPLGVRPYPSRALIGCGRVEDSYLTRLEVNATDIAPSQGGIIYISIGAGRNSVRSLKPWSIKDFHIARPWVQSTVDTILSGKP